MKTENKEWRKQKDIMVAAILQLLTGITYCARKVSLGLRQILRLATLGAYHFFRHSSYRMTGGKSDRTQLLRYRCVTSSWAAVKRKPPVNHVFPQPHP
jgi:hypothetical protein